MPYTFRVSLAGYDALTETNIDNYALYADSDNVLIKEKVRGSSSVSAGSSVSVAHGLSYIPMVLVFAEVVAGQWYQVAGNDSQSSVGTEVTTTNLILVNDASGSINFKYYIFYDQQV